MFASQHLDHQAWALPLCNNHCPLYIFNSNRFYSWQPPEKRPIICAESLPQLQSTQEKQHSMDSTGLSWYFWRRKTKARVRSDSRIVQIMPTFDNKWNRQCRNVGLQPVFVHQRCQWGSYNSNLDYFSYHFPIFLVFIPRPGQTSWLKDFYCNNTIFLLKLKKVNKVNQSS